MMILLRRRRRWHHHHHHHHRKRYSRSPCPEKVQTRRKKKRTTTTTFLERKKDGRKISLFLLSSLLLLLRVVKVVKVVKVARRVVGRRSAVDRDLWWSFSVGGGGVVEEDERDIFFFFFFCVCVGGSLSFDSKHTRNATNDTPSPFFSQSPSKSCVFLFFVVCVHFRVSNYVTFFFKRERAFCVRFRRGTGTKERRNNTACTHTVKHHPPRTTFRTSRKT